MRSSWSTLLVALLLPSAPAAARLPNIEATELSVLAARLPVGVQARVNRLEIEETAESVDLVLERFEVFSADAEVVVHGAGGRERRMPAPRHTYLRGRVAREPGSHAFLGVQADGRIQGIVVRGGKTYLLDEAPPVPGTKAARGLRLRHASAEALEKARGAGFECAAGHGLQAPDPLAELWIDSGNGSAEGLQPAAAAVATHGVRVAIETDYEFYARFNNVSNATAYVANLLGYVSLRYQVEIGASLLVQSVSLWTSPSDPWSQGSPTCGLMEFGRYWNKNRTGVQRTIAHFLSGKSLGGGVAWLGVLCSGAFGTNISCAGVPTDAPWGGGYGFTASISGNFNPANPTVMWDVVAVAHEIGHNFNSPHTHCYNNIGGNPSSVDGCANHEAANGCYSGAVTLPGPAGAASGTIMSYCHLVRGSYSDVGWSFGTNHPFGVLPGRVPDRMSAHLQSRATSSPACFAPVATGSIFADGFEAGGSAAWGGTVP